MRFGFSETNNQNQKHMSEAPSAALQRRPATPTDIVRQHLESPKFLEQIKNAMPSGEDGRRLVRGAITAMQKNPKIAECEQPSIFTSMLTCAQLGLQLDGREAHLVPFSKKSGDKWVKECTLVPDYKGLVRLALQSDSVSFVHADVVCENDEFEYDRGQVIKHKINFRADRGPVYCVYALARFKDGGEKAEVMSCADVEAIRNGSPGKDGKPWTQNWGEMAKKTVFKRLCKWVPLSAKASEAVHIDNSIEGAHGAVDVDATEVTDAVELPKRADRAPRSANATVVDAGSPPPPTAPQGADPIPFPKQNPAPAPAAAATPPPAKPKGLPRKQPAPAAAPPPPPPAPAESAQDPGDDVPPMVAWMNKHGITTPEVEKALCDYLGEDVRIDNVLKMQPAHVTFILNQPDELAEAILNNRSPV